MADPTRDELIDAVWVVGVDDRTTAEFIVDGGIPIPGHEGLVLGVVKPIAEDESPNMLYAWLGRGELFRQAVPQPDEEE